MEFSEQQETIKPRKLRNSTEANHTLEETPNASTVREAKENANLPENDTAMTPRKISLKNSLSGAEGRTKKWSTLMKELSAEDTKYRELREEPILNSGGEYKSTIEEKAVEKTNTETAVKEGESAVDGKEFHCLNRMLLYNLTLLEF